MISEISGTSDLDAAAVLAVARRARAEANAAEARVLAAAVEWARLHQVDCLDEAATVLVERGRDTGIPIAGPGAPLVSEFAVAEFATALGLSAASGRVLVGHALELAHRLPKTWARVQAGQLAPWRARRIAEETLTLTADAAGWVDGQVAPYAHKTGPAQTQRLVETAIARFMPDHAAELRERAAEQRYFTIDHDQVSFAGTSRVHGELDLADAIDLEKAVAAGAHQLAALGNQESLDVRRAAAVGILARGQQPLDLETGEIAPRTPVTGRSVGREVVLYVHLTEDALTSRDPDAGNMPVELEGAGGRLLTAGQVAEWCGRADTARITVQPVIDLHERHAVDQYDVPERIAERVRLRDRTCVHPYCHRPARRADLDHIDPWIDPDEGGPPGQTSTQNLAPLCRLHHRMKTHGGWTYTMVEPGVFLWRSPHGHTWLRDATGTTDLTPPDVDPPRRRTS
jgi:hypothetical protein